MHDYIQVTTIDSHGVICFVCPEDYKLPNFDVTIKENKKMKPNERFF